MLGRPKFSIAEAHTSPGRKDTITNPSGLNGISGFDPLALELSTLVDVFISYKQEEREAVQIIATALADLQLDVWFDTKLRAGGSFDEEIAAALRAANAVLVCWTPAAVQSEWVRGEATEGLKNDRLAACFLHPTELIPPFNLTHAENLSAWAGQTDDPAWIKLLQRIGELVGRPGLATYRAAMRAGASIEELEGWARANGADPLVDAIWARIALLKGEGAEARLAREKAEARGAAEKRKAQAEKSRRLIRERGLRDPVRERRRFLMMAGSIAGIAMLVVGAILYFIDAQARDRVLRDEVTTTEQARTFLAHNTWHHWHPITASAHEKFERLDTQAWFAARADGSIKALETYVADAQNSPQGNFLADAQRMLASAKRVLHVQEQLARMRFYEGPVNGTYDQATKKAIALFRYRQNLPVSAEIDDPLLGRLAEALEWWSHPRLEELHARSLDLPSEADYLRFAEGLGVDVATIKAVIEVEANAASLGSGFDKDGRLKILFERQVFHRLTGGRFDDSHPNVSSPTPGGYGPAGSAQYDRLAEAYALDPEAALKAASWGRFQVMGFQHRTNGYDTVGEFVRLMSQTEANQLEAGFLGFIRANKLGDSLQRHDWTEFARRYNGPNYRANQYDRKLGDAYHRIAAEILATTTPGWAASQSTIPSISKTPPTVSESGSNPKGPCCMDQPGGRSDPMPSWSHAVRT